MIVIEILNSTVVDTLIRKVIQCSIKSSMAMFQEQREIEIGSQIVIYTGKLGNRGFLGRSVGPLEHFEAMPLDLIYLVGQMYRVNREYNEMSELLTLRSNSPPPFVKMCQQTRVASMRTTVPGRNLSHISHGGINLSSSSRMSSCTSIALICWSGAHHPTKHVHLEWQLYSNRTNLDPTQYQDFRIQVLGKD